MDEGQLAQDLIRRTEQMRGARSNENATWQEIRDNVIPVLQRFIGEDPKGVKQGQAIVDETPEQAQELLSSAVHGMISNPALKWAEFGVRNAKLKDNDRVAAWLAHARDVTFDYMYAPSANLTAAQHETYNDLTSFGLGCLFTGDRPGQGLLYQSRPLREIYLAECEGRVDTVHRWFKLSAREAAKQFGMAKIGQKIREKAESATKQDDEFEFLHAVFPRSDRAFGQLGGANMPIASVYVGVDDKAVVRNTGFPEMPYAVPRWSKRTGEVYGRGPGHKALASSKMLQRTMKLTVSGAELRIAPPMMVADDGVMSDVRLHANGLTDVRAELMVGDRLPIRPIMTGGDPQIGEETMKGMRDRIQASFYNHLLQMMRDPRMTATQVIQIAEETLRILGPVIGRLQAELLGPMIERTFWVLFRAGAFAAFPMPPELEGQELTIEYVSPVAQAQKLAEAKGIVQTFGVAAQMAQTNPEIMDNFDLDASARALAVMFGMPRYLLRDPRKIADMRAARAQQQQQQELLNQARLAAGGIKDAASALPNLREGLGFAPDQGGDQLAA